MGEHEIWIPETADPGEKYRERTRSTRVKPLSDRRVVDRCRIPTPDGPCGHAFYEDEPEVRKVEHIKECVARNMDVVQAGARSHRPDVLKPWDPEYAEWLDSNKRGIAEGRVRW